jgi:hypothetical protein
MCDVLTTGRRSRLNDGRSADSNGIETDQAMMEPTPNIPPRSTSSSTPTSATSAVPAESNRSTAGPSTIISTTSASIVPDAPTLLATQGVVEEEDLAPDPNLQNWLADRGLLPEDFESEYGLLAPEDTVIIRPYGGEDDDILLQELRPNLAFIRRLEVSPGRYPRASSVRFGFRRLDRRGIGPVRTSRSDLDPQATDVIRKGGCMELELTR